MRTKHYLKTAHYVVVCINAYVQLHYRTSSSTKGGWGMCFQNEGKGYIIYIL